MNITETAIRRPVTISMFVVAVILFGAVSLQRLPLNLLPDISYPSLTVQTDYEDAAPEEIESLLTRPVEEAVGVVGGLSRLSSVSRSGQSEVVLEFAWGTNMDLASMDVREKLDVISLPRDAERPVILRFDPSYDPIMRMQLYGNLSLSRLRYAAEKEIQKALESTDGVAAVKVIGGLEEQIRIEIDEKRLAELRIPITQITDILRQENLNQASGSLYDLDANYLVRMLNEFRSVEEIHNIIIRDQEGRKIVLGDVARVWRGTKDRDIIARLDGKESVEMAIYKEGDANTVTVSQAIHAKLNAIKGARNYPKGVEYKVVFDQANFIKSAVNDVLSAAILGGILATIVLFIFLRDARSTLMIGLSIPISIMATFAMMYQTNLTLNIMSLGGIALGVGMLVDNAIVVLEAVARRREGEKDLRTAVYEGTREVGMAVTASTLTTVAVFLPLVFVEGIAGQLFKDQALTITYSLLASLLAALSFIPMALALRLRPHGEFAQEPAAQPPDSSGRELSANPVIRDWQRVSGGIGKAAHKTTGFFFGQFARVILADIRRLARAIGRGFLWIVNPLLDRFDRSFERISQAYPKVINWALDNKAAVFGTVFVLVILSAGMAGFIGAELIPPLSQGEFTFLIELPEGRPLDTTDGVVKSIEERVREYEGVDIVFSSVGGSNENQFAQGVLQENKGQIYVSLKDRQNKQLELDTIARMREELARYPEVKFNVTRPTLFSFKTPVEVEIFTFDLDALKTAAEMVAARLRQIDGLSDVQTTTEAGYPEIQIRFDRQRLARLGLEENVIATLLRNKIRGDVASRYREGDRQIDILVRASEPDRRTVEDIRNLIISNQSAQGANSTGNRQGAAGTTGAAGAQSTTAQNSTPTQGNQQQGQSGQSGNQQQNNRSAPIRLGAVAEVSIALGPAEIRRIRAQRAAVVSANLTGRDLSSVSGEIRDVLQDLRSEIPGNTTIGLGGQNEELETSYRSLMFALGLAVFLVYLVMASQFESLVHPFIIMFTVPLALVGVVFSLFFTGTTMSVMAILGVIILAGIVVNNAIVLIDYTNQLRRDHGRPKRAALLEAGQVRLRPIMMTTLTTVLGLIPMAIGWGEGAEVRAPMAITVMGGLVFSTLLTLVFIPVVYEILDRKVYAGDLVAVARPESGQPDLGGAWQPAVRE